MAHIHGWDAAIGVCSTCSILSRLLILLVFDGLLGQRMRMRGLGGEKLAVRVVFLVLVAIKISVAAWKVVSGLVMSDSTMRRSL